MKGNRERRQPRELGRADVARKSGGVRQSSGALGGENAVDRISRCAYRCRHELERTPNCLVELDFSQWTMIPRLQFLQNIRQHYQQHWGRFEQIRWSKGPDKHIEELPAGFSILRFDSSPRQSLFVYATCGMSDVEDSDLIECFILVPFADDDVICELLTVVAWHHRTGARLGCGHIVNFGRPWLPGSQCNYGLFSLPYLDGPNLEWLDMSGERMQILWLIPITVQERDFGIAQGLESLESRFESSGFNYANPCRQSVI